MTEDPVPAVQMAGITKTYPGNVVANDHVSLQARRGTIHAVVGENGAGKSTLMGVLYGAIRPDEGRIRLDGVEAHIRTPADALRLRVGMVPQHSSFIPALTLVDNAILGCERARAGVLDRRRAIAELDRLAEELGVRIPWRARAADVSVAIRQKAEIVKTLYRGARVVILDEPTAMLAPQETDALYAILRRLAASDRTVLIVTHRLHEVMAHAARVTVLRQGRLVVETDTAATSVSELAALVVGGSARPMSAVPLTGGDAAPMVGDAPPNDADTMLPPRDPWSRGIEQTVRLPVLEVRQLELPRHRADSVALVDFEVLAGEVLGVAGVDGSGQRELAEMILGTRPCTVGRILVNGRDVTRLPVAKRLAAGLAYCPEDRHRDGLIMNFSVAENLLLGHQWDSRLGGGRTIRWRRVLEHADRLCRLHHVRLASVTDPVSSLSGGNQQKVLIARALAVPPAILVALQPTRGLDIQASQDTFESINAARAAGMGVLLFSLDLDEILAVSDRIAVMYAGRLAGILPRAEADRSLLGHMMTTGSASP